MLELFLFILSSWGMTQILIYGKIFNKIRPKHHFFHCSMCLGFWCGVFIHFIMEYLKIPNILYHIEMIEFWLKTFIFGCLSSGTSYALSCIFGDDGININYNKED